MGKELPEVSTFKDIKMETQDWVNIFIGVGGTIATTFIGLLTTKFKSLEDDHDVAIQALNDLRILIATDYVKRTDLNVHLSEISRKLDKLEELEVQMSTHYARKEDLRGLGDSLGKKLDLVLEKLERKVDKYDYTPERRNNG